MDVFWTHTTNSIIPIMVGFIMLGYYEVEGYYTLWKFMIDEKHQNKGYGKQALKLGIDYLVDRFKVKEVYTAYIRNSKQYQSG